MFLVSPFRVSIFVYFFSGEDTAALTTSAAQSTVDQQEYHVTGKKAWVTNGQDADILVVLAKVCV